MLSNVAIHTYIHTTMLAAVAKVNIHIHTYIHTYIHATMLVTVAQAPILWAAIPPMTVRPSLRRACNSGIKHFCLCVCLLRVSLSSHNNRPPIPEAGLQFRYSAFCLCVCLLHVCLSVYPMTVRPSQPIQVPSIFVCAYVCFMLVCLSVCLSYDRPSIPEAGLQFRH
jgi:hypothetical protein